MATVIARTKPQFTPTILLLGLPAASLCGIDLLAFTSTPNFHGFKDVPPGFHFVFSSETASVSIREGFWFHMPAAVSTSPTPLLVYQWSQEECGLRRIDDAESFRSKLEDLWERKLSPYRQNAAKDAVPVSDDWAGLTSHVTTKALRHLTQGDTWQINSASCAQQDYEAIPGLSRGDVGLEERELGVLGIDLKRTWKPGAVGRERTDGARDKSWALDQISSEWEREGEEWGSAILGQMEICFIMILTIANYSCLEEWKRCLGLILLCKIAVMEHEDFFISAITLLKRQLQRCEDVDGGLFDVADQGGDLLKGWLRDFKRTLANAHTLSESDGIKSAFSDLEKVLQDMFGWELSDSLARRGMIDLEDGETLELENTQLDEENEEGEYAPTVIDVSNG